VWLVCFRFEVDKNTILTVLYSVVFLLKDDQLRMYAMSKRLISAHVPGLDFICYGPLAAYNFRLSYISTRKSII